MKVIALNGSPRKNGNTAMMLDTVLAELEKEGIETTNIRPCRYVMKQKLIDKLIT